MSEIFKYVYIFFFNRDQILERYLQMKTSFTVSWSSFDLTWFFFLDSSLQRQLCMYLNLSIEKLISDINLDRNYTLHIPNFNEQFPPLNSLCTCMYCEQRSQYIRLNSKKNSFHGNYLRIYGISFSNDQSIGLKRYGLI